MTFLQILGIIIVAVLVAYLIGKALAKGVLDEVEKFFKSKKDGNSTN